MGKKCPDINAALLYDCGRQRELYIRSQQMINEMEASNNVLQQQYTIAESKVEELNLIREANNDELIKLEKEIHNLTMSKNE
jgi:hypothetical protein